MAVTQTYVSIVDAFNAYAPNRGVAAQYVSSTAATLLDPTNKASATTLKLAGKLAGVKITGVNNVNAADAT